MKENKLSEEVAIAPLIGDVESVVVKAFKFVWRIICWAIDSFKAFFDFCIKNFWALFIFTLLGGALGYFSTIVFPNQYQSSMILELNIDSKAQLKNDVSYLNNLIQSDKTDDLIELFGISEAEAVSLTACEIVPFTKEVEKVGALNDIRYRSDDSVFDNLDKKKLLSAEDDQLTSKYSIVFKGYDQAVFGKLESGFLGYVRKHEELKKKVSGEKKSLRHNQESLLIEMKRLDTLQDLMSANFQNQMNQMDSPLTALDSGRSLSIFNVTPIEVQNRYLEYSDDIDRIDMKLMKLEQPYYILSHLNPLGRRIGRGQIYRALFGAALMFGFGLILLLCFKKKRS